MSIVPGDRPAPAQVEKGIEKVLSVQRPVVLAYVRGIRRRNPGASPAQVVAILERHYLAAVTAGGAAVGASSVIPGVGTGISLALSGVETAGFLETTALFAQSVTELHGIATDDPDRARTLVMAMMLGTSGSDLVKQLASQAAGVGPTRKTFWGRLVAKGLPDAMANQVGDRVKRAFVRRFATTQGAGAIGRAIPFGIGAVVGGAGNHLLGRKVVSTAREAFGPAPLDFPLSLGLVDAGPRPRLVRLRRPRPE